MNLKTDKDKVPFGYVIGYRDGDPMHLLYELLMVQEAEQGDGRFTVSDLNTKTTVRDAEGKVRPLLDLLIESGHVIKEKSAFCIAVNPWEA